MRYRENMLNTEISSNLDESVSGIRHQTAYQQPLHGSLEGPREYWSPSASCQRAVAILLAT